MAEQLIRTTSMQISEIAANVGFSTTTTFPRFFIENLAFLQESTGRDWKTMEPDRKKQPNKANQKKKHKKIIRCTKITSPNTNFLLFWYRRTKAAGGH